MKTRIRDIRRAKGLTLQDLAARVRPEPTTAQTIGRLETGTRKTSLDWLIKIADALEVHPAELLDFGSNGDIPVKGLVTKGGVVAAAGTESLHLRAPTRNPVAIKIAHASGDLAVGDTLICETSEDPDFKDCIGRDCLVTMADGTRIFGRLMRGTTNASYSVVPPGDDGTVIYDAVPSSVARPVMLLRHF